MNTAIITRGPQYKVDLGPAQPRSDAKYVEIKYHGRVPNGDLAKAAFDNQPACIKRLHPFGKESGMFKNEYGYSFVCDGNYGPSILIEISELPSLLEWLDAYFYDLGDDYYGGHWRTAKGGYSLHCYSAQDYTVEEMQKIIERERFWSTLDGFLADPDPGVPNSRK